MFSIYCRAPEGWSRIHAWSTYFKTLFSCGRRIISSQVRSTSEAVVTTPIPSISTQDRGAGEGVVSSRKGHSVITACWWKCREQVPWGRGLTVENNYQWCTLFFPFGVCAFCCIHRDCECGYYSCILCVLLSIRSEEHTSELQS